jgi:penicillin-binding protein 1C
VWRDVMMALHAGQPGRALPMPRGIEARTISFENGIEQPRREYFLVGTGMTRIAAAPALSRRAKIVSPVSGSVYALDPDIPVERQRMAISVSGEVTGHRLLLDGRDLGAADARPMVLAGPGQHKLRLIAPGGRVVDQILFTVR